MTIGRWVTVIAAACALCAMAVAQGPAEAPPDSAAESPPEDAAESPPADGEDRTLEEIFIPSEEIAADEEVTFPVNI